MPDERLSDELRQRCTERRRRLAPLLESAFVDALIIAHPRDIRYLTGFVGDDSVLVVGSNSDGVIISDARYEEFLEPWRASRGLGTTVVMGTRHRLDESVAALAASSGWRRAGLQAEHLTLAARGRLAAALGGVALSETTDLVGQLRILKDPIEVACMERGGAIQVEALQATLEQLTIGMSELELCGRLEFEMKKRGSVAPSFSTMVATGPRSSIIHHVTGAEPIGEGPLLIDWGATIDGYCSDMTRTFCLGPWPQKLRQIYEIVQDAQQRAIDACRPGRSCAEIDAVARAIISKAGYGDRFGHGLGHGLGLDIHEPPFFNQLGSKEMLKPGMVMTVEPGIYVPGLGGVRLEDDVLITDNGNRLLTSFPKGLDAAVLDVHAVAR